MTELFRLKSKEQALKEIDRRIIEAMKPAKDSGQLLNTFRQLVSKKVATPK